MKKKRGIFAVCVCLFMIAVIFTGNVQAISSFAQDTSYNNGGGGRLPVEVRYLTAK